MSCLEAYAGLLKLLMKGIFDPNVLWPLDKKLIFLLVTHVSTCDFTVVKDILKMMLQTPMTLFYSTVVALWILYKPVALVAVRYYMIFVWEKQNNVAEPANTLGKR